MGGFLSDLFSPTQTAATTNQNLTFGNRQSQQPIHTYYDYALYQERSAPRYEYINSLPQSQPRYRTQDKQLCRRQVHPPIKVTRNTYILNKISHDDYTNFSRAVSFIQLSENDPNYIDIKRRISNKRNFIIDRIEKIENPYLMMAYELKKEQKQKQYAYVEERLLFHGTKTGNVAQICTFNFNWRLCQTHKFGMGISFSPNSTYASNYSDEYLYNKVMIVAKVLISKSCIGNSNMVLPYDGCDTSQKGDDAIVIVKYEDNEFCPVFKINYHLKNPNIGRNKNVRNNRRNTQSIYNLYSE